MGHKRIQKSKLKRNKYRTFTKQQLNAALIRYMCGAKRKTDPILKISAPIAVDDNFVFHVIISKKALSSPC